MNDLNDKPYILALDSTAVTAAAAVMKGEEILASFVVNGVRTHSETLLATADTLIGAAGLKISDIGLFACAAGPGSFTGVRIGVSLIKGLAYPQNKPCAGVSTLEALAYNLHITARDALIVPVMDARRSQFYNALFLDRAEGRQRRLCADRVLSFDELMDDLLTVEPEKPIFFVGDGYDLAVSKLMASDYDGIKVRFCETPRLLRRQNAASVGTVALFDMADAKLFTHQTLAPVYLRMSQAERVRLSGSKEENGK